MNPDDEKLTKLLKTLRQEEMESSPYRDPEGFGHLYIRRGFEIVAKEKKITKEYKQEKKFLGITKIFNKRDEFIEYIVTIKKVPDPYFNHLLNRTERVEYSPKLPVEKSAALLTETFMAIDDLLVSEINTFLQSIRGERDSKLLNNQKEKYCPACGELQGIYAIKCHKCGSWVENDVFTRLNNADVELIKSKDLIIVTPTLLVNILRDSIEKDVKNIKTLKEALFCSYCYYSTLKLTVSSKAGSEDEIMKLVASLLIMAAINGFKTELLSDEVALDRIFNDCEDLYNQLDNAALEVPYDPTNPNPSSFHMATRFGQILYGKECNMVDSLRLFTSYITTTNVFGQEFSKFFIVDEEDFDSEKISKS
jgi:hypothetical protein